MRRIVFVLVAVVTTKEIVGSISSLSRLSRLFYV